MINQNFGILASISWNSHSWMDKLTEEDIDKSKFKWVVENRRSYDDLNFGQETYPPEADGYYLGHSPQLSPPPVYENSKFVEIVFFKSFNYHLKKNYIVGFYAFPEFKICQRPQDHPTFSIVPSGNVKSKPENIVLFENFVDLQDIDGILPNGRKLGQMGFNYLLFSNVLKILDRASNTNPGLKEIKSLKLDFFLFAPFLSYY